MNIISLDIRILKEKQRNNIILTFKKLNKWAVID